MNKSFTVGLAVVLLLIFSVAEGADWEFYGTANDCIYYYDVSSLKALSKGIKKLWIKKQAVNDKCIFDLIKKRTKLELPITGYENYSHTMGLLKIDCSLEKQCIEKSTNYDKTGNVLDSYLSSTESWSAIVPESVTYTLYKHICR